MNPMDVLNGEAMQKDDERGGRSGYRDGKMDIL